MVQIVPPPGWSANEATPALDNATSQSGEMAQTMPSSSSTIIPADFGIDLSMESVAAVAVPSSPAIAESANWHPKRLLAASRLLCGGQWAERPFSSLLV